MFGVLELLGVRIHTQNITVDATWCRHLEYVTEQNNYVSFIHVHYSLCFSERFL